MKKVKEWEQHLKDQDLAEKRRVAPGWLDRDEKILQPKRASQTEVSGEHGAGLRRSNDIDRKYDQEDMNLRREATPDPAGEALDRAFGGMGIQNR